MAMASYNLNLVAVCMHDEDIYAKNGKLLFINAPKISLFSNGMYLQFTSFILSYRRNA